MKRSSLRRMLFVLLINSAVALFLSQFIISWYPRFGKLRLRNVVADVLSAGSHNIDNYIAEPCPTPYRGTECSITVSGSTGRDATRSSGSITVNGHQVSEWNNSTGILLFRLGYTCELNESMKFEVGNVQDFAGYIASQTRDTLLVGFSGDYKMLRNGITHKLMISLGVKRYNIEQRCVYGFVFKIGYSGLTTWWKKPLSGGHFSVSKSVTQGSPISVNLHNASDEVLEKTYPEVKPGGHWRPQNCTPHTTIAIIIPFRDRESHLRILLNNLLPFLTKQNIEFTLYVVEQAGDTIFNRAEMMNIGYLEAKSRHNYSCYIFHDVDAIPEDLCNIYACSDQPRHFIVRFSKTNYGAPHPNRFGGVTGLTSAHIETINGFSNLFFAWGGEDDEIAYRLFAKGMSIARYPADITKYKMIPHNRDKTNPRSGRHVEQMAKHAKTYMTVDGLNSLQYTRLSLELKPLYTHIMVQIEGPSTPEEIVSFYDKAVKNLKQLLTQKQQEQNEKQNSTTETRPKTH